MAHVNQEIPRGEWAEYLGHITRQDHDQWVRVECLDAETGDQPLADRILLVDISLETRGSDAGAVQLTLGSGDDQLIHRILEPEHLRAELEDTSGALECLEISERGTGRTLVFFEHVATA